MDTINLNTSIEQLFENDLIDGETYLFCLDNNINKFSAIYEIYKHDFHFDSLNNCDCIVNEELVRLCKSHDLTAIDEVIDLISVNTKIINDEPIQLELYKNEFNLLTTYKTLKSELSRRAINVFECLESVYDYPNTTYFQYILGSTNPHTEFLNCRNAGKNTVSEMVNLVNIIKEQIVLFNVESKIGFVLKGDDPLVIESEISIYQSIFDCFNDEEINTLEIFFRNEVIKLSTRSRNRVNEFFKSNGFSIIELCKELTMPNFIWCDVKNIGRNSLEELEEFPSILIKTFTDLSKKDDSNNINHFKIIFIQNKLNINMDFAKSIFIYNNEHNHFPFFRIFKSLLTTKGRDWDIINNTINVFNNKELKTLIELASTLGITRERIRQRRIAILKAFEVDIKALSTNDLIDVSIYKDFTTLSLDNNKIDSLNKIETVDFNANFVYFILSILFSDSFVLLGDVNKAFLDVFDEEYENLFLIPKELFDIFDFDCFILDLNSKLHENVYENYTIQLESFILLFFKEQLHIDKLNEILNVCQVIIYKKFGILNEIDGTIIIRKNTTKNLPDIAEDVLRKEMRQMSLEDIFEEIENIIPGLCKNSVALRGSILRNKNIIPVGRESVYVLKEWHELGIKGGTIRDLVVELLLPLEQPLSLDDITKYVKTHRNDTDSYSIYNNLRLDKSKQFSFYQDGGLRYIGLTSKSYSLCNLDTSEFKNYDRKDFKERLAEIEEFILENNRFPFSSTIDINEESLYRFMNIQRGKIKKGTLSVEQLNDIEIFEKKFGSFEMSKRDFDWDINFNQIKEYIALNGCFPTVKANSLLYGWLQRQSRFIREDKLSEYQIEKLKTLYNIELDA